MRRGDVDLTSEVQQPVTLVPLSASHRTGARLAQLPNSSHRRLIQVIRIEGGLDVLDDIDLLPGDCQSAESCHHEGLWLQQDDIVVIAGSVVMVCSPGQSVRFAH